MILIAASGFVLVALAGLSAFQARRYPRLVWGAFGIPAVGALASIGGLVVGTALGDGPVAFGLTPWHLWIGGVLA